MSDDQLDDWIEKVCDQSDSDIEIDDFIGSCGPALSDDEIAASRITLASWHDTQAFKAETDKFCSRCNGKDWFNRPQLKFLQDAFVLARFACDEHCDAVMLTAPSDQWPDGRVRRQGKMHNIEIVSTHGGRKLGREYSCSSGPQFDPVANWIKRADTIPFYLDEAIQKKISKGYSAPCWLVVYLNIDEWGIRHSHTVQNIRSIKKKYLAHFEAISVRWKGYQF